MNTKTNIKKHFPIGFNPTESLNEKEVDEFLKNTRHRNFLLSQTGISPRVFNLWKKLDLINIPQQENTRPSIKLNFSDFIWLKIICDLRRFGCPLKEIRKIKELCYSNALPDSDEYINKDELLAMVMLNLKKKMNYSKEQLATIEKNLREKNLMKEVSEVIGKPMNHIEMQILGLIIMKSEVSLIVYINDEVENTTGSTILSGKMDNESKIPHRKGLDALFLNLKLSHAISEYETNKILSYRCLNLPLIHYLTEFISDNSNEENVTRIKILSIAEMNLLKEVRKGNIDEIKIIFKDKRIERVEVKKEIQKNVEARLIETFRQDEFADITYKVANGKMISFKKTTKYKFNN